MEEESINCINGLSEAHWWPMQEVRQVHYALGSCLFGSAILHMLKLSHSEVQFSFKD